MSFSFRVLVTREFVRRLSQNARQTVPYLRHIHGRTVEIVRIFCQGSHEALRRYVLYRHFRQSPMAGFVRQKYIGIFRMSRTKSA